MPDPATTQATFCATVVDEWARSGVAHAVLAPGSRSTPLALALLRDDRITVHVHHDERCAGFMALGFGLATIDAAGRPIPAVALCTSGTAATHFHAAVVEAHQAGVPLLVCTADRPPELRDVGAPQAIDQTHLYGRAVRWFHDPGPPDEAMRHAWRSLASRAVAETRTGPVHLNLPFREPLVGEPGDLPRGRDDPGTPFSSVSGSEPARVALERDRLRRPLVVAGRPLIARGDVPVLADPRSGLAGVTHADALLRVPALRGELRPDLVARVGPPPASRVVNEWIAASGAVEVVDRAWFDPSRTAGHYGVVDLPAPEPGWVERWRELDALAETAVAAVLADHPEPTEPGTARALLAALPAGAHLVAASSMPIRDLEWYAVPRPDVTVHANRGANGIDGTMSTALGVALATGAPTAVLLGDVAFLHDSNALIAVHERGVDVTIVVVDNDGGGIFSFLPQAETLAPQDYELLFGTPHGVRPEELAAAHGLTSLTVEAADAVALAVEASVAAGGVHLVVVRTDRQANRKLHDELNAAVAAAVTGS
jgi:2-succinyl-5-enolpyruvyl-6-hydroxy-3-cyclohexene-1-carboxylate synthase